MGSRQHCSWRKPPLQWAVYTEMCPTIAIGFLPSYYLAKLLRIMSERAPATGQQAIITRKCYPSFTVTRILYRSSVLFCWIYSEVVCFRVVRLESALPPVPSTSLRYPPPLSAQRHSRRWGLGSVSRSPSTCTNKTGVEGSISLDRLPIASSQTEKGLFA